MMLKQSYKVCRCLIVKKKSDYIWKKLKRKKQSNKDNNVK